ncbi:MAG TPA: glycosyltransferase family 2 protein [Solirubrobacteraceae bacterium]|jgi:GT2 family glycosyltransferase|nr:glycosyltransferase family 2 protein [Solirubrobacteraceae bacterium]
MSATITAIVVAYGDANGLRRAVDSLLAQTLPPLEVLVIDNGPPGSKPRSLPESEHAIPVRSISNGENLGYVRAANLAAANARGDWLFFLNPDAVACPACLHELLAAVDGEDVGVVGAQVLLPDGRVNAGENPVSIVGISWSGRYGGVRERGAPRDAAAVSGAALLARRSAFLQLGGMCPRFFMYVDDTDLAWRMRLSGRRVRFCPRALVVHDYQFEKGRHKWFYLERNRGLAVLSNLRVRTLVLLAPLLAVTELAIVAQALSQGWLTEKLRAWGSLASQLPRTFAWRKAVQRTRNVSDYRVLVLFSGAVESELLDKPVPAWANGCVEVYRRLLLAALRYAEDRGS